MNVLAPDDVGVADFTQNGDLALEQSSGYFALDIVGPDLLHGDRVLRQYVGPLVYSAETSFSYLLLQVEYVVLDLFQ